MIDPGIVTRIAERVGLKIWPSFVERACCDKKEIYLNGGWRGGKSLSASFIVFLQIYLYWLRQDVPRNAKGESLGGHLIWLVGPTYDQTREEFGYIRKWADMLGLEVQASTAKQGSLDMTISWPGKPGIVNIVTKSTDDPESLGSVAPVMILGCECGQFSEEARTWIQGRQSENNATLIWSGTFHNDDGKEQHLWYERESAEVKARPMPWQQAFALPSWENTYLYGDCTEGRNGILGDPTLAVSCPDDNHGPAHSGLNHPIMRRRRLEFRDDQDGWDKRYGGIPTGVLNPVYPWSKRDSLEDFTENVRLVSMSAMQKKLGVEFKWLTTAGGIDPGLVHPAALTVSSENQFGQTWTRMSIKDETGSADSMWAHKAQLQKAFRVKRWGGDPVGLRYQPTYMNIDPMTGSLYAREARVKIVNGLAMPRHDAENGLLFIDSDVPGNVLLFGEIQRTHRKRMADGSLRYDRTGEDMVASWENSLAELHGQPEIVIPKRWKLPALKPVAAAGYRSVS